MSLTVDHNNEQLILANAVRSPLHFGLVCDLIDSPQVFLMPRHQNLFDALLQVREKKIALNIDNILSCTKQSVYKPECDFDYITQLKAAYPDLATNLDFQIKKLKSDYIKTKLLESSIPRLVQQISDPMADLSTISDALTEDQKLIDTSVLRTELDLLTIDSMKREYEDLDSRRKQGISSYPSGYKHLNKELTEGFAPGRITVIAARPSMGKSSFVAALMLRLSTQGVPSALFALEMDRVPMIDKFLAMRTKIPLTKIIRDRSQFTPADEKLFNDELDTLSHNRMLFIDDKPSVDLNYIKHQIMLLKKTLNAPYIVVFIDLFGQVGDIMDSYEQNMSTAYEKKLRRAHILAKDLNIHLVLVNQLRRDLDKQKSKRPELHYLKNSGAWEEVADNILLLHREKYYENALEDDILEVWIKKQRMGERNKLVSFLFDPITTDITPTDLLPFDMRSSSNIKKPDAKAVAHVLQDNFVSRE